MIPDFTLVVGLDAKHLEQFRLTYPTWKKNKPGIFKFPLVAFYDRFQLSRQQVEEVVRNKEASIVPWPPEGTSYERAEGEEETRFNSPQRAKMLSGFVHVPPSVVTTPYWLKLDCDVIAMEDNAWVEGRWFEDNPAIVASPWGFTKPANQILVLDDWVKKSAEDMALMAMRPPLNLVPNEGWERLCHPRIISWAAFFHTGMNKLVSEWCTNTCGVGKLPVPSQDGVMFYCAKRMDWPIHRISMKKKGFEWWSSMENIRDAVRRAMR